MTTQMPTRSLRRRITINDIAAKAGVAVSTVSSALHDTGRIGDQQRQRIQQLAKEMGYRPNLAAQLLSSNRTGRLALLLPTSNPAAMMRSGFAGPLIADFIYQCTQSNKGYHIEFIDQAVKQDAATYNGPDVYTSGLTDGAIVIGYIMDDVTRNWLADNDEHYPCVWLQESGPLSVSTDYAGGIYKAARYLYEMGHRKVAYMSTLSPYRVHMEGLKGFKRAVEDFDLDTHGGKWMTFIKPDGDYIHRTHSHADNARTVLKEADRPTAIVAHDVICARSVVYTAMSMGLKVPDDLSIITNDSHDSATKSLPILDTVAPDIQKIVSEALKLIQMALSNQKPQRRHIIVDEKFIQGQSVKPLTK